MSSIIHKKNFDGISLGMDGFVIKEIISDEDIEEYYILYKDCFPYEIDWSVVDISSWIKSQKYSHIFGLFDKTEMIGFRHVWCIKDYDICNVPYAGIKTEYRGLGIYPKLCAETEAIMSDLGYRVITNEVENPETIESAENKLFAERRINMFKYKLGYSIVKNTSDLKYERNSPPENGDDDLQKSQLGYLLGFKEINHSKRSLGDIMNSISKVEYEELYWSIRYIERGTFDRDKLMKLKPISNFITNLHISKYSKFDCY